MSQLAELRAQIGAIFEKYLAGSLDTAGLVAQLETFGVSMDLTPQQLQDLKRDSLGWVPTSLHQHFPHHLHTTCYAHCSPPIGRFLRTVIACALQGRLMSFFGAVQDA